MSSGSGSGSGPQFQVPVRLRRALMYVPGSNPAMLAKITNLNVDTICMDLEDAVSDNQKSVARGHIVAALNKLPTAKQERMVRINPVGSGYEVEDLQAILSAQVLPDAIVIPKVEHPDHLKFVCNTIHTTLGERGSSMKLVALIETTTAILNLPSIVGPAGSPRLVALIFGADDYAASVGAVRSSSNSEVNFARQMVLIHAKQAGLQAIDLVNIGLSAESMPALVAEATEGYSWGYTGKQIIHPKQIEPVQKAFSPSPQLIEWSVRVVSAAASAAASGQGAFSLDGRMIDAPTVKKAQQVTNIARACGLLPTDGS